MIHNIRTIRFPRRLLACLAFCFLLICLTALPGSAQQVQTISGTVLDEDSKMPLNGVVVHLEGQPASAVFTDSAGHFRLTAVPLGRQTILVTYMGYEPQPIRDIVVTAGKSPQLTVNLKESLQKLQEVQISGTDKSKARALNDMAMVSARSFNVEETKKYAGALGDPSRMAANFAGVSAGNDARNDIIVRGNSPAGMLWQLEGINIPNPNHFGSLSATGGPVGMLNNNNIDKSDFMTGAFPAQYGNALAGVFDIHMREGNKDRPEFVAQMGFNGFELGAEGPLGKNKRTTYMANYRYSTLGVFQQMGIDFGVGGATPLYQDMNYKVTHRLDRKSKLVLFGLAGSSRISFMGKDVDTSDPGMYSGNPFANEKSRYGTSVTGIRYERQLSAQTFSKTTLAYSSTREQYDEDSISTGNGNTLPRFSGRFRTGKWSANSVLLHKLSAKDNLQLGVTWDHTAFDLINKEIHAGVTEEIFVDQKGNFDLVQAYAQWKHRFNRHWSVAGGLHGQYMSIGSAYAAEPRFSVRYVFNARHGFSLGYGLHHQTQGIYTYFVQTHYGSQTTYTNKGLGFTQSNHLVLSYDWNINARLRFKAEGYYQRLSRVPVGQRPGSFSALTEGAGFSPLAEDSLVNKGSGYNYGLDLTAERFFDRGYYFLVTGSLFRSRYKGSDGIERNTPFNTGYVLNVLGGKEFRTGKNGVWAVNLKMSYIGGRYLTPVNEAESILQGKAVYQEDKAFSEKQQDYFRTDLKLAYRREYKRSTLEIAVDLQNLTNHANIFSRSWDEGNKKMTTNYQQGFFPVPTLRYTF